MPSRRTFVASVAAATTPTTLAGCLGGDPADGTDRPSDGTAGSSTRTTSDPAVVTVDSVEPLPVDGPIRVLPDGLGGLLVEAARSDGPTRGEFDVCRSIPPAPELLALETVELRGTDEVDGTYAVEVEGGNSYRRQYVADTARSVPESATVVDGGGLSAERREFVRTAVDENDVRVEPHTELGTWARRTFDGGYVRLDGEVYHGREQERTDAGLMNGTVWYVLSLTPVTDTEAATVLDCSPVDVDAVDALLDVVARNGRYPKRVESPSDALRSFASATEHCMLHKLTLDVSPA